jgi:hypothetical protein
MQLAETLVDSNAISAQDYQSYVNDFLKEAKQLLKKQMIMEKNRSIELAQMDDDDNTNSYSNVNDDDNGNNELSSFATLLAPFAGQNSAVHQFLNQLLKSDDKRLRYNTFTLLLRNHRPVPDTMLNYFAAQDDYRYELYADLKQNKLDKLFPATFNNPVQLAKSKLFDLSNDYRKPDSLVYLDKMAVELTGRKGFVYFFKYKGKKDDNTWKLASVGMVPDDPKKFEFDEKPVNYWQRRQYNFTEFSGTKIDSDTPVKEQLKKALKKMLYSRRNSAAQFYKDEERMRGDYYPAFNVGE